MATAKKVEEQAAEAQPKVPETEYTVSEFAAAAEKVFGKGITPDIVMAAFKFNHMQSATRERAKEIVAAFAEREVK